jgi:IrrE N-terminal-like domain
MFGPSVTSGYRVMPRSINDIRRQAAHARKILLPKAPPFFGMATFIERLFLWSIIVDVVEDGTLPPGVEACCLPEQAFIQRTPSTYNRACNDEPRARFTVIHELGHIVLVHTRTLHREDRNQIRAFEDSEWQANQFAAEFIMPLDQIRARGIATLSELMLEFQVSEPAADVRMSQLHGRGEI